MDILSECSIHKEQLSASEPEHPVCISTHKCIRAFALKASGVEIKSILHCQDEIVYRTQ